MSQLGRSVSPVTITNGTSLSGAIDLAAATLACILMPAAWTAAGLSFAASDTLAGTYVPVFNEAGAEYTVPSGSATASQWIKLPMVDFMGIRFLKVRSGTNGTPVNQSADRILKLVSVA